MSTNVISIDTFRRPEIRPANFSVASSTATKISKVSKIAASRSGLTPREVKRAYAGAAREALKKTKLFARKFGSSTGSQDVHLELDAALRGQSDEWIVLRRAVEDIDRQGADSDFYKHVLFVINRAEKDFPPVGDEEMREIYPYLPKRIQRALPIEQLVTIERLIP